MAFQYLPIRHAFLNVTEVPICTLFEETGEEGGRGAAWCMVEVRYRYGALGFEAHGTKCPSTCRTSTFTRWFVKLEKQSQVIQISLSHHAGVICSEASTSQFLTTQYMHSLFSCCFYRCRQKTVTDSQVTCTLPSCRCGLRGRPKLPNTFWCVCERGETRR